MKTLILLPLVLLTLLSISNANAGERVSVLTLNVAGLPDALTAQDHPKMRMAYIAQRASKWDLVAYQEDFYYSSWLDTYDDFTTTYRSGKWHKFAFFWPWLRKSGLTIKTNWDSEPPKYQAYSECHGHRKHGSDCFVPKGVMCTRTLTPGGLTVDFCTTHMDAGSTRGSVEARRSQIVEYQAFLPPPELDIPWVRIEAGDYNLRVWQEDIKPLHEGRDIVVYNNDVPYDCVDTCANDVDFITVTTNELVQSSVVRGGRVPMFDLLSDHPGIGVILDFEY
jgi:hypothetical protein